MALNDRDPHNLGEYARAITLGIRAGRREARGKSTTALEARMDAIRAKAQAREDRRH